jgi:hypothetical protein
LSPIALDFYLLRLMSQVLRFQMGKGSFLVELLRLPFLYGQGTDRALTNTRPKAIAKPVAYHLGLPVDQSNGTFRAGYDAVAAAIA